MIVSLTIVRYKRTRIPFALLSMALHRLPLALNRSCIFWKLLGCGNNGTFDLKPDWQQWGLLAKWNNQECFDAFNKNSFIKKWWNLFATEQYTILCQPIISHGKWDRQNPFEVSDKMMHEGPVAVLTRATIRIKHLRSFWKNVDTVAALMQSSPGYITSFGIGEAPVYRQATFSVWENSDDVKNFAYRSAEHSDVIKKTRAEGWYSEELFARFKLVATMGTVNGSDPLKNKF